MAVKVTLTGKLADILGKEVSLPSASTIKEALIKVANMSDEGRPYIIEGNGEIADNIIILLNGENIEDLEQELREGDELFLLLPIAGG